MFIADGLVFLELQKTGGSHIRRLLQEYAGGYPKGKHNRAGSIDTNRYVIGSIRNPWDWYVSLWAYGVGGQGALRARTAIGIDFDYYRRVLHRAMGKNRLTPREFLISLFHDARKPVREWQETYRDASEPVLFRRWLKLLLDERRRFDVGEGYGFSPLSHHAGLLTYRYFRLYTMGDRVFRDRRLADADALAEYDRRFNIARGMIRTESLEEDFIRVLRDAGCVLTDEQVAAIRNREGGKTNVSRREPSTFYYDEETVALVAQRERYLIGKYDYRMIP